MNRALFFALVLLGLVACEPTTLVFENQVPGVTIENMRWTTSNQTYQSPDRLLPGQASAEIDVGLDDEGRRGRVTFEVDLNGRRVALEAEAPLKVPAEGQTRFVLTPDTPVRHPLLQEAPMALWAAPE
ncbi:MAG: hypothetical protein KC613_21300 [Myxococcales bacterium]|nr:hypothetical protein [Myxococcales bacterium]MCB9523522.1 hypothetical protein [Myxococcales bacterium]